MYWGTFRLAPVTTWLFKKRHAINRRFSQTLAYISDQQPNRLTTLPRQKAQY